MLARREWNAAERSVVVRGLIGRCSIAIEPLICAFAFTAITVVPFILPFHEVQFAGKPAQFTLAEVIAPIFALGAIAFFAYAIGVLIAPMRAYIETFKPLFVMDGYVQYRSCGAAESDFIAVLDHQRKLVHEWKLAEAASIKNGVFPALIEFSYFGGIHRIDGRETGILPKHFMPFGIGNSAHMLVEKFEFDKPTR
jgi:hypothetical protein